MKKKILLVLLFAILVAAMCGCSEKTGFPADLVIEAEDVVNAPKGEYNLIYTVNNFSKYEKKYELSVSVSAYDARTNNPVAVKNNRSITVQVEHSYTVVVRVNGKVNGEPYGIYKTFGIEAVKSDRTVTFMHDEDNVVKKINVPYGGSIDMLDVPALDDRYTSAGEGYRTEIKGKRWVVYNAEQQAIELTEEHLTNITENIPVYSEYTYEKVALEFKIHFVTDGSEVSDYLGNADTIVPHQPASQKEGYTFACWCTDEERKEPYNWKANYTLTRNITLYARFIKDTEGASPNARFTFAEAEDDYGNECYRIEAKDKFNTVGQIVLPATYNGKPVLGLTQNAFKGTQITYIKIPSTYQIDCPGAFANCRDLETVEFEEGNASEYISTEMFWQCVRLTAVNIPSTVHRIGSGAFTNCTSLSVIKLPESLSVIGAEAFMGCSGLNVIDLPKNTETVAKDAFKNCVSLIRVGVNDKLKVMGAGAFGGCACLEQVEIGENSKLSELGDGVFEGTAITEITLPAALRESNPLGGTGITVGYYPAPNDKKE